MRCSHPRPASTASPTTWSPTRSSSTPPWPGRRSWQVKRRLPWSRSSRSHTKAISTRGSRPRSRASRPRSSRRMARRASPRSSRSAAPSGRASDLGTAAAATGGGLSDAGIVLMSSSPPPASTAAAEELAALIRQSSFTVALTGAGISVPSGIPDFRTPGEGLWEKVDPMEVAHIDAFRSDPARFWRFYRPRLHSLGDVKPNDAHRALAELESRGLLEAVITQNIDMLHLKAGSERVIEVHGSIRSGTCQRCGTEFTLEQIDQLFDDQAVAICP